MTGRIGCFFVVLGLASCVSTLHAAVPTPRFPYTGTDYYQPLDDFNECHAWQWLRTCYLNGSSGPSPRDQVIRDTRFIAKHHLGGFQRIWVSLDQVMTWDNTGTFKSLVPAYISNLDDALSHFARWNIKVDLVLFTYSRGARASHQFRPSALDGLHPVMRAGYLHAARQFLTHLAANKVDASTVAVVDLQNEAYYQLDQFFSQTEHLGAFTVCRTDSGTSTRCVERTIIYPWLSDLYHAARSAAPSFLYTVSDAGALLTTDRRSQASLAKRYPVDLYDIHLYDDQPWNHVARWKSARQLNKSWFSGEVGCGVANVACTYDGTRAATIDTWWLHHLDTFGARAVLVENSGTAWTYPNGPNSATLTDTGRAIQAATVARQYV